MTLKKRYLRVTNLLFLILIAVQFLPNKITTETKTSYVVCVSIALEVLVLVVSAFLKKPQGLNLFLDIIGFLFVVLIAWTLATAKFNLLSEQLFPPPGRVFWQFLDDIDKIIVNICSSLGIIVEGYLIATVAAIPLGLFIGWSVRLGSAATYISKFLSAIPPIVYIPYGIALLPTFRSVSVMVIFLASFWPIFASTMSGVMNVEGKLIDSAKVLNTNRFTMLFP
ncbi:MAG: ABC transporter permease [Ruminococcus sp.]|nr:ABC transporter permease [Ruminococcus sp.]